MDPFATLGLPRRFDLDSAELERRYRELQKALHPDRFAAAPASERRMSLSRAVEVNEAYRVLRDDLKRAEALLELASEGLAAGAGSHATQADPEFLMEMLELREALGEAETARAPERVQQLAAQVQARSTAAFDALRAGFDALDAGDASAVARLSVRVGELRYYRRFVDQVRDIEEELGG